MEAIKRELNEGTLKLLIYTKDGVEKMQMAKGLVVDLYQNVENFDKKIVYILRATPSTGHTLKELLDKYFEMYKNDNNLYFTDVLTLLEIVAVRNSTEKTFKEIETHSKILKDCGFTNIIWKRVMGHVFGNPAIFLYTKNDAGKNFVKKGANDTVIDRCL